MFTYPIGLLNNVSVDTSFKFSIDTSLGTGTTFALPLPIGSIYDLWWTPGDGAPSRHVTAYNDANATYDYGVAFSGQITITGKCGGFFFNNGGDKLKVKSVDNWGDVGFDRLDGAFYGCTNLISLPVGRGIVSSTVSTATNMFRSTGFSSIPAGLFDEMPNITGANTIFFLSQITSIPDELFRYNPLITTFSQTFGRCPNSITLGEDIFYYNALATGYALTFERCVNIVLPTRIFNLSNLSIVTNFSSFMQATSIANSGTGSIQDVWNYALSASSVNAFINQTGFTNYASIPNGWKGL
jgi:hypothetical protein